MGHYYIFAIGIKIENNFEGVYQNCTSIAGLSQEHCDIYGNIKLA